MSRKSGNYSHDIKKFIYSFASVTHITVRRHLLNSFLLFLVLWRSLGTLVIFLYLLEETSLLVLLPVGLGACVEVVINLELLQAN